MIFPELSPAAEIRDIPQHTTFDEYREFCDAYSGLMRVGIDSADVYEGLGLNGTFVATNDELHNPLDESVVSGETRIHLFPGVLLDGSKEDAAQQSEVNATLTFRQLFLDDALVEHITGAPDDNTVQRITSAMKDATPIGSRLLAETGVPEYVFFSKYDASTETANRLKEEAPQDIVTPGGQVITASREEIMKRLPELSELHESVFSGQTLQVGYYGGLDKEGIEAIVTNPDFNPIAAFDQETGEALMFMLYAPNLRNFDALPWLNPRGIQQVLGADKTEHVLTMPLVITSKLSGLGLFSPTVQLAGYHVLYEHKPDTVYLTYESNGLSVLYTPKVIHRNTIGKLGFKHLGTVAEVTYVTEQSQD
jgi:hypothetical protein